MKNSIFFLLFSFSCIASFAQKKQEAFYVFKKDWSPAKGMDDATFFMHKEKLSDSVFVCRYYNVVGPMVKWETYKDDELTIPNGRFVYYNEKGMVDSTGIVRNGRKHGPWNHSYSDSLRPQLVIEYADGRFIRQTDYINKKIMYADREEDLLPASDSLLLLAGNKGAKFKGGAEGWRNYLQRYLVMPDRLQRLAPKGTTNATCTIVFDVDTEGAVSDVYLERSFEWSADSEALRLIRQSPKWIPAVYEGRVVKYKQKQSITMQVVR